MDMLARAATRSALYYLALLSPLSMDACLIAHSS